MVTDIQRRQLHIPPLARLHPAAITAFEALALAALSLAAIKLLQLAHLAFFLPAQSSVQTLEVLRQISPAMLVFTGVLVAPLIEESVFRGIPFVLLRSVNKSATISQTTRAATFWVLGCCGAVLFALSHVGAILSPHLPLPQLMFGLWSWRVVNLRGLRHSFLLHGVYNSVLMGLMAVR